jgi:apolipoprotein N-acyltransferase
LLRLGTLAAIAGSLTGLFWQPIGLGPLLPLTFVIAFRGLRLVGTTRQAILFGLVFAASRYAVGAHFLLALVRYSYLGILLYLFTILFIAGFGVVESWGAWWFERSCGVPRALTFGVLYTILQRLRTVGDFSLPADDLAHAMPAPWLAWTPWTGHLGVTLSISVVALLLEQAIERRDRPRHALALATLGAALWFAPPLTDIVMQSWKPTDRNALSVAIVQPSVELGDKLDPKRWPETWARIERLTLEGARGADLIVWPETARPGRVVWHDEQSFRDRRMEDLARRAGAPILYGCEIVRMREGRIVALYNGAALARPEGGGSQWYGKRRLVPFVEAVPFARWIGRDHAENTDSKSSKRSFLTLVGHFEAGPEATVFEVGDARIGMLICFEGLYANLARRSRIEGANALCVITNDGWWGHSVFPWWHARMVAVRARELGVPVIRAANNGISSSTDAAGRMHDSTRLDEVTVLRTTFVPGSDEPTFYARFGDWLFWALLAWLAAAAARARLCRSSQSSSDPSQR